MHETTYEQLSVMMTEIRSDASLLGHTVSPILRDKMDQLSAARSLLLKKLRQGNALVEKTLVRESASVGNINDSAKRLIDELDVVGEQDEHQHHAMDIKKKEKTGKPPKTLKTGENVHLEQEVNIKSEHESDETEEEEEEQEEGYDAETYEVSLVCYMNR